MSTPNLLLPPNSEVRVVSSVQLVLTVEERSKLLLLIHQAVQAQGLNVAADAVWLARKIQEAGPHVPQPT